MSRGEQVPLWFGHKTRLDGIRFDVSNPRHELALASDCDIVEPRLPDRAVRAAPGIIGLTKRALDETHNGRNVVTYPGDDDRVNMVRHDDMAQQQEPIATTTRVEDLLEQRCSAVVSEDRTPFLDHSSHEIGAVIFVIAA